MYSIVGIRLNFCEHGIAQSKLKQCRKLSKELFPNLNATIHDALQILIEDEVSAVDTSGEIDDEAGDLGLPFTYTEEEGEWEDWLDASP